MTILLLWLDILVRTCIFIGMCSPTEYHNNNNKDVSVRVGERPFSIIFSHNKFRYKCNMTYQMIFCSILLPDFWYTANSYRQTEWMG